MNDLNLENSGQRTTSEFHTVLNYTDPSLDYVYLPDGDPISHAENKTFKPPDVTTTLSTSNSTTISVISSSRSILLPTKQDGVASNLTSRFYTSLTSSKPEVVGRPDACVATVSCQVGLKFVFSLFWFQKHYVISYWLDLLLRKYCIRDCNYTSLDEHNYSAKWHAKWKHCYRAPSWYLSRPH